MSSQSKIKQIITSPTLSPKQKTLFLSLEAEAIVDYMSVSGGGKPPPPPRNFTS